MTKEQRDQEEGAISRECREAKAALDAGYLRLEKIAGKLTAIQADLEKFRQLSQTHNAQPQIPARLHSLFDGLPGGDQIVSDMNAVLSRKATILRLEQKLKPLQR
jgi:hypothetical protein